MTSIYPKNYPWYCCC